MEWSKYAVGGAAARPDSFTGLNPEFQSRLWEFVQAAESELGPGLQITSAYRSPETQARLYEGALKKYGSEAAARKWVAPPGKSQHNTGMAADFAMNGGLLRDADSREAQWIRENAARFGLAVPMSWEPWQVELASARGGAPAGGSDYAISRPQPPAQGQSDQQAPMGQQRQKNALQQPQLNIADNRLDPRSFMMQRAPVNRLKFT